VGMNEKTLHCSPAAVEFFHARKSQMAESLPLGVEQRPVGSPATEECHDIGNPRFATDDGRDQSGHRTGITVTVDPSARSDGGGSDLNLQREGLIRSDWCEGALYLLPFDFRGVTLVS
jgi:hypothetical protein